MNLEILLSPFDASVAGLSEAAHLADGLGIGAIWMMDHLAGPVHPAKRAVLECLTSLTILAQVTDTALVGPLVLNPVARHPVVLAQALSTIGELTVRHGGSARLQVGIGAGGGAGTYGAELVWAGLVNHPASIRRARVVETLALLDHVWAGSSEPWMGDLYSIGGSDGFLVPTTRPPIVVAGYGPHMARIAGQLAEGFNTGADADNLESLISVARESRVARPGVAGRLPVSTYAIFDPIWLDADSPRRRRLVEADVDSLILVLPAPHDHGIIREISAATPPQTAATPPQTAVPERRKPTLGYCSSGFSSRKYAPMTERHAFLSDEWIEAVRALRAEYADRVPESPPPVRINVVITGCPHHDGDLLGHIDTTQGQVLIERGHLDRPELTITLDYETAYTLFVSRDPQASMRAFFSGKILVEGDVTKLLALQGPGQSTSLPPDTIELYERLDALTEK